MRIVSRKHKLLTKELLKRFKQVGRDEATSFEEKTVICKFFNPYGRGTWLATEFDPETNMFFGYVDLGCPEWGYFSLQDLETPIQVGNYGFPLERDCYFKECKFKDISNLRG